jgi:hypothetical protein
VRKLLVVVVFTLLLAATAVADQLNFNFTLGASGSVTATSAGMTSGPSLLTNISDTTTMVIKPFAGNYVNGNTGPAISLMQFGPVVIATFDAGGPNSVLVEDAAHNVLVSGDMDTNGSLLSTVPAGTGSFLGTFHVTFVSPVALALFGLGPSFEPNGSVALTIGNASFNGTTFTGAIGGGSVTIQSAAVPEPVGLGILGMGLLTVAGGLKRWRTPHDSPSQ